MIGRRAFAAAAMAAPAVARAQGAWPDRPLRIVVGFAPGGATDSSARAVADRLSAVLGQPVVVENRSGAGGSIGGAAVAQARPDGTTFLLDTIVNVVNPFVLRNLAFDYARAFVPVTQVSRLPLVLVVRTDLPAANLAQLIAMARVRDNAVSVGNAGMATASHLAVALLAAEARVVFTDSFYRGGADAARDVANKTLDAAMLTLPSANPLIQGATPLARVLAVASGTRTDLAPGVPTMAEQGFPGAVLDEWTGMFAPTGTPPAIIARMQAAVAQVLGEQAVKERMAALGAEPVGSTPEAFADFIAAGRVEAARLVRAARIEPQ
ncbi:Bug family tripartite tricarboxylate transporter substrate binding protein [Humitalea sp. 24SJ18S-53]|uniref:Bug family tripartite tricarboxylate transporter substrate binding protein n=1 Tax=Humitalea sp. 24SJ18S-53 TaxID=3422307 RepID=UPI003D6750D9